MAAHHYNSPTINMADSMSYKKTRYIIKHNTNEENEFSTSLIIRTDFLKDYSSCLPILWKSSGSCTSTFSLWNMWYSACSQMGGIWLNCRATEYASYSKHREQNGAYTPYQVFMGPTFLTRSKHTPMENLPKPNVHKFIFKKRNPISDRPEDNQKMWMRYTRTRPRQM